MTPAVGPTSHRGRTSRARSALAVVAAGAMVAACSGGSLAGGAVAPSPQLRATPTATAPTTPAAASASASPPATSAPDSSASRPETSTATGALLTAAVGGDGDSWKDTTGREYRLGLVNTPEYDECFGRQATAARKQLVAGGFRAQVYTTDQYGRSVAVVQASDGTNVNVWLARNGYANDRYLAEFRHENPALATELDIAFAAAKRDQAGLWAAC